jgi:ubiquitin carboxyl-terminal hydrolase 14
METHKKK